MIVPLPPQLDWLLDQRFDPSAPLPGVYPKTHGNPLLIHHLRALPPVEVLDDFQQFLRADLPVLADAMQPAGWRGLGYDAELAQRRHAQREVHLLLAQEIAWKWFVRLAERGTDATGFGSTLATLAARSVRSGRRVCGQEKVRDVLSLVAQQRHAFAVSKLPEVETLTDNPLMEALHDNRVAPVPEQVCFRVDFPAGLATLSPCNRQIVDMALGYATCELSQKYGVSPSRISQLRREFHDDWARFCGDLLEEEEQPMLAVA